MYNLVWVLPNAFQSRRKEGILQNKNKRPINFSVPCLAFRVPIRTLLAKDNYISKYLNENKAITMQRLGDTAFRA